MDTVSLLSLPAFAIAVALIVISAWVGHTIGRKNEEKRKTAALTDADRASKAALQALVDENQQKIDVLNKANTNELDGLKQAHTAQIDQLNTAHLNLVDSLKSGHSTEISRLETEHSGLIDKLNTSNNAAIGEMEQRRHAEIEGLRSEHQALVDTLRGDHAEALRQAEQRYADDKAGLDQLIAELRAERDEFAAEAAELKATVTGLRDEIKEDKLNNRFSVSKSGEKLIRVVRSVQELASELDETSRTVTGGEYSFFDQIKDQGDRETVLSLTAGRHVDDAPSVGPDGEVDDADVPGVDDAKGD
jgi:chromosome segregation ATPase